jgi:acetyl esterase/lipase
MRATSIGLSVFVAALSSSALDLPKECPLWDTPPQESDVQEKVRSFKSPGTPTGVNRAFSSVSLPTYSVHRPKEPNGVGLVICPGGGFRDIWIDREGHDLAIRLKEHGITSLVLKYRTRPAHLGKPNAWKNYQEAVRADARQAIRILRKKAAELGLKTGRIGICGFSAGGHLAISTALAPEPSAARTDISGQPDFAGLFYPGVPNEATKWIENRGDICPMFIVNARVDKLTPVEKCIELYARLLKAGANAELHVFSKGGHGFGLGTDAGESAALWPTSFTAWLSDSEIIQR